jgi:hypothetical protein
LGESQRGKGVLTIPFSGNAFAFNKPTIETINQIGGVYGLFRWDSSISKYVCRYVGMTDNLRRRLMEHFNNPPIAGVTHFFAEALGTLQQRIAREQQLILEFDPPGNKVGKA